MSRHFMTFIATSIKHYFFKNNAVVNEYFSTFEYNKESDNYP